MIINIKRTLTLLLLTFGFVSIVQLAGPAPASAQLFEPVRNEACKGTQLTNANGACDKGQATTLNRVLRTVLNLLSLIIGVVAVFMIIVNGLRFITSGGDANSVGAAKKGLLYAVIGLAIVALAQFIVRFVLKTAQNAGNPTP